jgi:ABC-2 type transport system permease protein
MNIWNLTKKDLAVSFRDRGTLVWLFVLPVVFTLIFATLANLAFSGSPASDEEDARTPLPIVNLDANGELSQRFIEDLDRAGGFRPEIIDQAAAEQSLKTLKISRYLVIPQNYSADLSQGKPVTILLITHPDSNASNNSSALQVANGVANDTALELQLLDGIRQMGAMQAGNPDAQQAFNPERTLAQAKSQFERSRSTPLVQVVEQIPQVEEAAKASEFDFSASIVPGMVVLFVFLAASTVAHSIFEERKMGSLRRLLSAPLTRSELMLGKLLPIWLLTLVQIVVIFAIGAFILPLLGLGRLGIGEHPVAWAVASMIIALCSTSLGILIAALATSEGQITGLSNALLWVAGFLGGALLPSFMIQQIPVLNILSRLVPQSYATRAYYEILGGGASLVDVLPELGVLLVFTAVFFFIGVRRFKFA